jgi:hypothetical protein
VDISKGNLYAGVLVRTTGPDPYEDFIYQICIMPVDESLNKTTAPILDLTLTFDESALGGKLSADARMAYLRGVPQDTAQYLIADWFDKIGLRDDKRLIPVSYRWPTGRAFISNLLSEPETLRVFDPLRYRDILTTALYLNDRAAYHCLKAPFSEIPSLNDIINRNGQIAAGKSELILRTQQMLRTYAKLCLSQGDKFSI